MDGDNPQGENGGGNFDGVQGGGGVPPVENVAPAETQQQPVVANDAATSDVSQQPTANTEGTKKSMDPKTKKLVIILCSVFGGLLVLGGLACLVFLVLVPALTPIDYAKTYEKTQELEEVLWSLEDRESCGGMMRYVSYSSVEEDEYTDYVEKCSSDLVTIKEQMNTVSKESGLRDKELKELWDIYMKNYDEAIGIYEKAVALLPKLHEFSSNIEVVMTDEDWYLTADAGDWAELVKPLREANNAGMEILADGFETKLAKAMAAYAKQAKLLEEFYDIDYNSAGYEAAYEAYKKAGEDAEEAYDEWQEWSDEHMTEDWVIENLLGVNIDDLEDRLVESFENFYDALYERHEKAA